MNDLISRQDALNSPVTMVSEGLNWIPAYHIKDLPSAQPDVPDTNVGDMISRQAAIDDIKAMYEWHDVVTEDRLIEHMKRLPSAQPEGIYYVKSSEEDYEKIAEQLRKIPIVLTLSEPEIVRCAECKWFQCNMQLDGYLPKGVDEFECRHWCGSCDPTDFCSYAERKGEEDEDE